MFGKIFFTGILFFVSTNLIATVHTGTISKLRGTVEILSGGTKSVTGKGPHVKYNEKYYTLTKPGIGDKVFKGQILRTGKRSLVRIIFENGDQFMVGPGSEYVLSIPDKKAQKSSLINLTRGKLRAIISKDGPRNKMEVETRNVAMGVRGTDFYVDAKGYDRSEVSVIRGEVKLEEKPVEKIVKKKAKEIKVVRKSLEPKKEVTLKTGYSAAFTVERKIDKIVKSDKESIKKVAKEVIETDLKIKRTTKQKLVSIQKNTVVKETPEEKKVAEKVDEIVKKKIEKLEKKAVKVTLDDIKTHTPELYKKIKKEEKKIASADQLSTKVVAEAFKEAPKDEKINADDLEDLGGDDAYEKYFKF
jgi:hypothetical protein